MIKSKFFVLAAILAMSSGNVFALRNNSENCNFPQHFKIEGPSGTHIINVEAGSESDFTIVKISDNTFHVEDKTQCKGKE